MIIKDRVRDIFPECLTTATLNRVDLGHYSSINPQEDSLLQDAGTVI